MKLYFISPADQELIDAFNYYENQILGLGNQFISEFNNTIKLTIDHPTLWKKVGKRTRRALLKRFPYIILYILEDNTIHITCIAHQHREPEYYIDRII